MRVLAFTPPYRPTVRIGAWLATHRLLRHLVQRGHEVTSTSLASRTIPGDAHDGVTYQCMTKADIAERAEKSAVIVSHATGADFPAALAESMGRPHVRLQHGPGSMNPHGADLLVCSSRSTAPDRNNVIVCHPVTEADEHRVDSCGERVTIVNCSKDKGIKTVWRTAHRLPSVPFLGVLGSYGHQLEPRTPNFEVMRSQLDMRAVWARTRILVMPSAFETWGMVGVEAMCNGIPVIAHPTPGLCESLGGAGIFVNRDDIDGWVEAIRDLDDPDHYAAASVAARARFEELEPEMHAGLDRFADAVEALCGS